MTVHLVEDHPTHFKLSNGAVITKSPSTMCAGGVYDFVSKQAKMLADGDPETAPVVSPTVQPLDPYQAGVSIGSPAQPQGVSGSWTPDPAQTTNTPDPVPVPQPQPTMDPGYTPQMITSTETSRTNNDPNLVAANQNMGTADAKTAEDIGNIKAGQVAAEAQLAEQKNALHTDEAKTITAEADARKDLDDKYQGNVKGLMDQYAKQNIVPKSIFQSDNIGQNIAAAMSIGLGALGGALTGSNQNVGLEIINKAIDRDIEAQKINLEKIPNQVSMLGVAYRAARDAGLDDEKSRLLAKSKAFDAVADQYEAMGKASQSAMVQKNAALEADKIRTMSNDAAMKATSSVTKTTSQALMSTQKIDPEEGKSVREYQDTDAQLADIRLAATIAQKKGDLGPLAGTLAEMKGAWHLSGANSAELQRDLQNQMTSGLFTTRYSDQVQKVVGPEFASMRDNPEQFWAKQNAAERDNTGKYMRIFDGKPQQRDVIEQPLRSSFYKAPQDRRSSSSVPDKQTVPLGTPLKKHK